VPHASAVGVALVGGCDVAEALLEYHVHLIMRGVWWASQLFGGPNIMWSGMSCPLEWRNGGCCAHHNWDKSTVGCCPHAGAMGVPIEV